jgi:hypothetical protein
MVERLGDGVKTFRKLNQRAESNFETPSLHDNVEGKGRHRRVGYFIGDNVAQFLANLPRLFGANSLNLARYVLGDSEPLEELRQCFPLNQKRAPKPNRGKQLQEQLGRPGLDLKETLKVVPIIV